MIGAGISALADPPVLFFVIGAVIGLVGSNLEIPPPITKFLSLYLLLAIGFKGGQALAEVGVTGEMVRVLGLAVALALLVPLMCFVVLRRRIEVFDAAAIAATYGSVSAVTFVVATEYASSRGAEAGGHMAVALVVMESPAIVMAVLLATWIRSRQGGAATSAGGAAEHGVTESPLSVRAVLHEAFTDGAHLILIGALVVGVLSGGRGGEAMAPFTSGLFPGLLAFFMLEMGLLVVRQLRQVRDVGRFLVGFGMVVPFVNASIALTLGRVLGLEVGDLGVLAALAASGSYIVVPAVIRYAIPEARPSRYFTLALGVTFPVNVLVGVPLYHRIATMLA